MDATPVSLLERLQKTGSPDAWARFVELYSPVIYSWSRRMGLQDSDAADLVQDVLTQLLTRIGEFRHQGEGSFRSWLRTVTVNKWRETCRTQAAQQRAVDASATAIATQATEAFWEREYRQHVVGRALQVMRADFEPATWRACWEVVVVGKPAKVVASQFEISIGAVYAAKFRVMSRLRQELGGLLD